MLKAIIEKLNKIEPCYTLESFEAGEGLLNNFFFVVDLEEKELSRFNNTPLFIYIYAPIQAYSMLKNLKNKVFKLFHKKRIAKKEGYGFFWIEYDKEVFSHVDKILNKRCMCLEFRIPTV
ncbi:MAG: hypothetical protein ACTTJ6_01950 [Treponema sp.]